MRSGNATGMRQHLYDRTIDEEIPGQTREKQINSRPQQAETIPSQCMEANRALSARSGSAVSR